MKIVASLLLLAQSTLALQMILSTRDPQCLNLVPKRPGGYTIDVTYTISGVNEQEVSFYVSISMKKMAAHNFGFPNLTG